MALHNLNLNETGTGGNTTRKPVNPMLPVPSMDECFMSPLKKYKGPDSDKTINLSDEATPGTVTADALEDISLGGI